MSGKRVPIGEGMVQVVARAGERYLGEFVVAANEAEDTLVRMVNQGMTDATLTNDQGAKQHIGPAAVLAYVRNAPRRRSVHA